MIDVDKMYSEIELINEKLRDAHNDLGDFCDRYKEHSEIKNASETAFNELQKWKHEHWSSVMELCEKVLNNQE